MKGLLYKDWLMLCRTKLLYLYLPIVALIPLSSDNTTFTMILPAFFAAILPLRLMSMDEKSRWDQYTQTLPVSRAQIVHAKYSIGFCLIVGFSLLATASKYVQCVVSDAWRFDIPAILVTMIAMGLTIHGFMMPFIFKFGTEKGTAVYYATLAFCGVVTGTVYGVFGVDFYTEMNDSPWMVILPLLAFALFVLSWRLSVWFYSNRDL